MSYRLKTFGSYTTGGRLIEVTGLAKERIQFTPSTVYERDPNGLHAVEQAYVQYFVPEQRNDRPPLLLVHGGGMTGAMWETTPDGRTGWLHLLLERGHEVHVIDNVERGRAGWHPDLWPGRPATRSLQEAWTLFRIGRAQGFEKREPFSGQRFPVSNFDQFCRSFVPRWIESEDAQTTALKEVLSRLGTTEIICHSQGAQIVFNAIADRNEKVTKVIALEPSGLPRSESRRDSLDVTLVFGGWTDIDDVWRGIVKRCRDYEEASHDRVSWLELGARGLPGHSHMMMMDHGHDRVLSAILDC